MNSAIFLSLWVSGVAMIWIVVLGTALGFVLARGQFPGRQLLQGLLTLPLVFPPTVTGYYLILLFGRQGWMGQWLDAWWGWTPMFHWSGAVIAAVVVASPLMIQTSQAAFQAVPPELEEASWMLGQGAWQTFRRVTLPLASGGLLAGAVLSFARALGEFGATLMLAGNIAGQTQTMPLAIYDALLAGNDQQATWLVVILTAFSLVVVYLALRLSHRQAKLMRG